MPRAALTGADEATILPFRSTPAPLPHRRSQSLRKRRPLLTSSPAKHAVADFLGMPLAKLTLEERAAIDGILAETLNRKAVLARVRQRFRPSAPGESPC